ncbi:MAG TPA: TRAP transporter large permease [Alphaproteobacteria bacterium]|nr:TRAP transporter large permease [Alphaproteobacteria bacterium]
MIAALFLGLLLILVLFFTATGIGSTDTAMELAVLSGLFVVFFMAGVYVAAALGLLGLLAGFFFSSRPLYLFVGQVIWNPSVNFVLVAVPLFILMGEILLRSGLSDRLYRALNHWFGGLPGGLLHTNIVACGVFAAVSGSSVATSATIGKVALPYFEKTPYHQRLVLGSLAAGGTLGILIPPSINLIIYGLLTETSVGRLYMAGFIPGFMLAGLFMVYILLTSLRPGQRTLQANAVSWGTRLVSLIDLVPTATLIALVLGSIYAGLATPTEAAALGVIGALVLAAASRRLNLSLVQASVRSTARTTSMIGLIILGAFVLNYAISSLGLPQALVRLVTGLDLPPWAIMSILIVFYIAIGTFMEAFSMMITTIPIVFPIVVALGYDAVWFGIILVILCEMALISPPDGMNMYIIQGMRLRPGPITDVFVGVLPFFGIMFVAIVVLMLVPQLALWLPSVLIK